MSTQWNTVRHFANKVLDNIKDKPSVFLVNTIDYPYGFQLFKKEFLETEKRRNDLLMFNYHRDFISSDISRIHQTLSETAYASLAMQFINHYGDENSLINAYKNQLFGLSKKGDEVIEPDFIYEIENLINENVELYEKKNQDYGSAVSLFGFRGVVIRMSDKINRFDTLSSGGFHPQMVKMQEIQAIQAMQVNESIGDTMKDLFNYSLIAKMLFDAELKYSINNFETY